MLSAATSQIVAFLALAVLAALLAPVSADTLVTRDLPVEIPFSQTHVINATRAIALERRLFGRADGDADLSATDKILPFAASSPGHAERAGVCSTGYYPCDSVKCCQSGTTCVSGGCCPNATPKTCGADGCMPTNGVCCGSSGEYCNAGYTCTPTGCRQGSSPPPVNNACAGVTCSGHGTCIGGGCSCDAGYNGGGAQECLYEGGPSTNNNNLCAGVTCNGHGTCNSATGNCNCDSGYNGGGAQECLSQSSTTNLCTGVTCNGHGTCNTATGNCRCDSGYNGGGLQQCLRENLGAGAANRASCAAAAAVVFFAATFF
ncbi:hypothetical protein DFJ74DRAFT_770472 [Hyaloraphidium curvatum]|nr:hypothetical protein DFJ74DRAFT_770472 [Hyaloraphidium curvatum]